MTTQYPPPNDDPSNQEWYNQPDAPPPNYYVGQAYPNSPPAGEAYPQVAYPTQYGTTPSEPNASYEMYNPTTVTSPQVDTVPGSGEPEAGQGGQDEGGFSMAETFSDKTVRRTFIKKVYITLTIQLLVTFGIVCVFTFVHEVKEWVQANTGFYIASYIVFLVVYIVLACVTSLRRKHPINIIMLGVLTLSLSYMTGTIASYYDSTAVVICIAITLVVCIGVTIFCMQTRFDFTALIGVAFMLSLALLFFGFLCIWPRSRINFSDTLIGLAAALIFVLWLAIDTQMVLGGKKYELSPEEYVFAAMNLYIDIVYIFLIILALFGKG